jgi:putative membrane protein
MSVLAQVFIAAAVLVHVLAFVFEVLLFERPAIHRDLFTIPSGDLPAARLWAFNVGFYNLFLAAGPVLGVILYHAGQPAAGRALAFYGCGFMFLAGVALAVSDRLAMSRPKGAGVAGAIAQAVPSAAAVVALLA